MATPEYPSDKLDQYMVRFPDGMREKLKEAAARNGRSMNAEIVARLSSYDDLHDQLIDVAAQRERLQGEIEIAQTQLARSSAFRGDLEHMSDMLRRMHDEDRAALKEIDELTYFLEADRVRLEAQVLEEKWIPAPPHGPDELRSTIAQRIVWVVDERMRLISQLLPNILKGVNKSVLRRAYLVQHAAGASPLARELADIYASEAGLEDSDAAAFFEFANSLIESMPDEKQPSYRQALREIMPRLFVEWTSDSLPYAYGED